MRQGEKVSIRIDVYGVKHSASAIARPSRSLLALKEFESAKKCCRSVLEERAQQLGDGYVLYYHLIYLLVHIYEKQGDIQVVNAQKDIVTSDVHSTHWFGNEIERSTIEFRGNVVLFSNLSCHRSFRHHCTVT